MIIHILSWTHKYDCSVDCVSVAGELLLLKEGVPSAVWEECLSASMYSALMNAILTVCTREFIAYFVYIRMYT